MHTFFFPRDYLDVRGNIQHCWEIHKARMKEVGLPYVDYFTFYNRVKRNGWDLYRAIHCPADLTRVSTWKKVKVRIRTYRFRFIYLFKGHDRVRRSKRY